MHELRLLFSRSGDALTYRIATSWGDAGALIAEPARWVTRGPGGTTVALQDWFLPNLYQRGEESGAGARRGGGGAAVGDEARGAAGTRDGGGAGGVLGEADVWVLREGAGI